jgi:hypothetical protein
MTTKAKAQHILGELKSVIEDFVVQNPGTTNSEISRTLGLESNFQGSQRNYLVWSVLGILVNEGRIRTEKVGSARYFYPCNQ